MGLYIKMEYKAKSQNTPILYNKELVIITPSSK